MSADTVWIDIAQFPVSNFQKAGKEQEWEPHRYAAWIIPPGDRTDVQLVDLGPAEPIDRAVTQVRQAFRSASRTIYDEGEADAEVGLRKDLQALARLILEPLLPHIGRSERWLVSPDGMLWLAPCMALSSVTYLGPAQQGHPHGHRQHRLSGLPPGGWGCWT